VVAYRRSSYWSLEALAIYVRAAADRSRQSMGSICRQIANEPEVILVGCDDSQRTVHRR
jgi:hypothetical protein